MEITLLHISNLCKRFNVEFKITNDKEYIFYHFGDKVKWCLPSGQFFSLQEYIEISMLIAAHYPDALIGIPD